MLLLLGRAGRCCLLCWLCSRCLLCLLAPPVFAACRSPGTDATSTNEEEVLGQELSRVLGGACELWGVKVDMIDAKTLAVALTPPAGRREDTATAGAVGAAVSFCGTCTTTHSGSG